MSANAEMNRVNDSMIPDSIPPNAIDPPINLSSDEDTSQVDYLGTTFISEDWGDDPFDVDDKIPEKNMMMKKAGAKILFLPRKWVLQKTMKI